MTKTNIKELLELDFLHLDFVSAYMYSVMEKRLLNDNWDKALSKDEVKAIKESKGLQVIGKSKTAGVYRISGKIHAVRIVEGKLYCMCLYGTGRISDGLMEQSPF